MILSKSPRSTSRWESKASVSFWSKAWARRSSRSTEFSFLHSRRLVDRMIVICPNTFKAGWVDEIEKHGFRFAVHVWRSSKKIAAAEWLNKANTVPRRS